MVQNALIKILLFPFALLYGAGVWLRDLLYRQGLLQSVSFSIPIISIGNLSVGGTGKTPHIEYLIRLLQPYLAIGTLSRGYKRKTRGFLEVRPTHEAEDSGDEPLQFKRKFPEIMVAVAENRVLGIPEMLKRRPDLQVILLDDAFQHRAVKPGLNILLTAYDQPYTRDLLLPAGRLREMPSAAERADIIIVSKCPATLKRQDAEQLRKELNPLARQRVFFSHYRYKPPYYLFNPNYTTGLPTDWSVLLLTAIANESYLIDYLSPHVGNIYTETFADHHFFTPFEMAQIKNKFDRLPERKKFILTTEKDATRLYKHRDFLLRERLPVFVLPVEVEFLFGEGPVFDEEIKRFLLEFTV